MSLHVKQFSCLEPLLILHGLFGSSDNWLSIARYLEKHFHVVLVDLPNHGASDWVADMSYPNLARALHQQLISLGLKKVSVVGHSLGGKVLMQLCADFPDFIQKAVILDIAPKHYPRHHDAIFEALLALPIDQIQSRQDGVSFLMDRLQDRALVSFLTKNLMRSSEGFRWRFNLRGLYAGYADILLSPDLPTSFSAPTLLMRGACSDYVSEEDFDVLRHHFKTISFQTIDGAGHWLHADQREAFLASVNAFLMRS